MAAAMASCRVLGGAEGVALLPLQIQSIEGKRPGRCNARFVGGKFGSCLTIGRKRTAVVQSEFVTATLASRVRASCFLKWILVRLVFSRLRMPAEGLVGFWPFRLQFGDTKGSRPYV